MGILNPPISCTIKYGKRVYEVRTLKKCIISLKSACVRIGHKADVSKFYLYIIANRSTEPNSVEFAFCFIVQLRYEHLPFENAC